MSDSIHGHQVLEMLLASGKARSRASLIEVIEERFGRDARFHTCSAQGMSAADLISFLEARGKLCTVGEGMLPDRDKICSHE